MAWDLAWCRWLWGELLEGAVAGWQNSCPLWWGSVVAALLMLLVSSWTAGPTLQGGRRLQPVFPGILWPALSSQPQGPYHTGTAATQALHERPWGVLKDVRPPG